MAAPKDSWYDQAAGPVVRPYAVIKGRTEAGEATPLGMIDLVQATGQPPGGGFRPGPEHRRILSLCHAPVTVVDVTSDLDLPVGVVRVLIGDLIAQGMVQVNPARQETAADARLLRDILDGLRAL